MDSLASHALLGCYWLGLQVASAIEIVVPEVMVVSARDIPVCALLGCYCLGLQVVYLEVMVVSVGTCTLYENVYHSVPSLLCKISSLGTVGSSILCFHC